VKRGDWILTGTLVLLAGILVWVVSGTLEAPIVNAGDAAPKFSVVTEDGKTITPSNFGGKLLVLNFWASWCAPCIAETPTLNQFSRTFAGKGVVVLGVSMDANEKQYKDFLQHYRINFETSRDPEGNISASYGTFLFPDSYIIDPSGKVVEKIVNAQNWMAPEFLDHIQKML
jgi:cytochrome c biogenesis protein CcmG, thiol:disulfide interchange protein DsbE